MSTPRKTIAVTPSFGANGGGGDDDPAKRDYSGHQIYSNQKEKEVFDRVMKRASICPGELGLTHPPHTFVSIRKSLLFDDCL